MVQNAGMTRVLLLLPTRTYRTADFLAAAGLAFTAKGFDVDVSQDASLATGEFCQFSVVPR